MRIVLDAMGSDHRPTPDVAGAVKVAREDGTTVVLVGPQALVRQALDAHDTQSLPIEVVDAPEVIAMDDPPTAAADAKRNSSMHVGMRLVKDGQADAFVTMGNTGAALVVATLYGLGRIRGVRRPALSAVVRLFGKTIVLLDIGANADTKAEWLAQFAQMGTLYAERTQGLTRPRVGLLSNGEEEGKGNTLVQEATTLLRALPLNFVGNVEPKQALAGAADVVVTDGFTGNILIKTFEAAVSTMFLGMRDVFQANTLGKLRGAVARPALRAVYRQMDSGEIGGAPLLGVNGVVIIGHGRSEAPAIANAVRQARLAVESGVIGAIQDAVGA